MRAILVLFAAAVAFSVLQAQEFTVLFTASLNGNLDGCFCKSNPKSGLVKRAYFLNEYRKQNKNTVLVESGDILSPDQMYLKEKAIVNGVAVERPIKEPYIFEGFRYMKYDAIVLGDQDLSKGVAYFLNEAKTLPYLNANVTLKEDGKAAAFGTPYLIKNVGGVKVGIIGATGDVAFRYQKAAIKNDVDVESDVQAISKYAKELAAQKVDVIMLVAHAGYDREADLLKKIPELSIVVGGHDQHLPVKDPDMSYDREEIDMKLVDFDGKYLLTSGPNGNRVGAATFRIWNGKVMLKQMKLHYLDYGKEKDDPKVREWINEVVQKEMKAFEKRRVEIK
ncbi:MAG: hypothetical protein HZC28_15590 [Spirochaetes bacterium]|nr:hypothetical protein [Spirochaetota bacterium]